MNDNEKKYFELEKEYLSELKKLNNKQNKIIATGVFILSISPLFLNFLKINIVIILIITIFFSFIGYKIFEPFYDKPLINTLKNKIEEIFKEGNKIENLTNFKEYLDKKINKKISIFDLTVGQAITSSAIFCSINIIEKSFNNNNEFCLNRHAINVYFVIFIISIYLIKFFDSYERAYRTELLSKKLIKIINEMITEEYRNNN